MARIYTAQFSSVAVTAAQDLFAILAGAAVPITVHEIFISQMTEIGDAMEEMLSVVIKQGATAAGSVGTAPAMVPRDVDDAVAAAVVRANDTTIAGTGTIVTTHSFAWNVRVPLQLLFTPELRPYAKGGRRLVVGLLTAPADSITMSGTLTWSEGG